MWRRIRSSWATVSSAPWRRAPLLLRRHPGVLATVAGAVAVAVAAVSAVPLFLSSAGSAAIEVQVEERCPRDTGVNVVQRSSADQLRAPATNPFAALGDRLGPSSRWARLPLVSLAAGPGASADAPIAQQVTLLARQDALDHVELVGGSVAPERGVWLSDRAAAGAGLRAGEVAVVGGVEIPVRGVYRDLTGYRVDRFWCSNADLLLVQSRGFDVVEPPPVVLVDRWTLADVMERLDAAPVLDVTEAPLGAGLTVERAEALIRELACHGARVGSLTWCEDGQPLLARRVGGVRRDGVPARDDRDFVARHFSSSLPFVVDRARAIRTSVRGGIWPVATFAGLAGLGLVAASSALWFDRRRRELTLLSVRGVSPGGLAAKAVLELIVPLVGGAAAGVGLAAAAVIALGPSPTLERAALRSAVLAALATVAVAALVVALVVVARLRAGAPGRRWSRWLRLVPVELALVWLVVVSHRRLGEWGVPVGRGADVSRVDPWGLLFPVLFLVAVVAGLSRLLAVGTRPMRALSRGWPLPLHLAIRRIATSRAAAVGLVAATAVSVGVLTYAATMDRSLHATLDAKVQTYVGTDVVVAGTDASTLPGGLAERATEVQSHSSAMVEIDGDWQRVTAVAIDPDTFAEAAYWDATFADVGLDEIVERLSAPPVDGVVPAVGVGIDLQDARAARIGAGDAAERTLRSVTDVEAFPATRRGKPTVYLAASALEDAGVAGVRDELWIDGDRDQILEELHRSGWRVEEVRHPTDVADRSPFLTVAWTFGFMRSLGVAAGVLALGGVAVHLDARRRGRVLAHALLRRMGVTAGQHRGALVVELAGTVLVGCAVGLVAAASAAWLAHDRLDPVPHFRPAPLLRLATGVMVTCAALGAVVVVLAGALAQRRAERDDPVEVLRAG